MLESLENNTKISFDVREGDKKEYGKYLTEVKKRGYDLIKNIGFAFYCSGNETARQKIQGRF